jgi:YidC/Oxa1 family membrane protein insertase
MRWLTEVAQLYRFFRRTAKPDRAIVFYAEHRGYWVTFEGLLEQLTARYNRSVCYVTSDPTDPVLERHHPGIRAFYIAALLPLFMAVVDCRAFVLTVPELQLHHLKRSMHKVHYVYVFHSPHSVHLFYADHAFDHYDSMLCVGPHQVAELRRLEALDHLPPKVLVEAGYYRVERLHAEYQRRAQAAAGAARAERPTVLIAPSWGTDNLLEAHGRTLIAALLDAGYPVIVRPHPETMRRYPDVITGIAAAFGSHSQVRFETSVAGDDALLEADVLITDWSAVAVEYAFGTERPVLYVDTPLKRHNPRYRELGIEPLELQLRSQIGLVLRPEELPAVAAAVTRLIAERATRATRLQALRNEYLFAFGRSSEIGAQHILEIADATTPGAQRG